MSSSFQTNLENDLESLLPLHILIVESDPKDAERIAFELKEANVPCVYQVTSELADYQKYLETQSWNVVLSDFQFPDFTAYQVLETLQQRQLDIPLILVTGMLGEEAGIECIKAGMTDYVLKDRLFRLPMVLERSLREHALRQNQKEAVLQLQRQASRESIINRIVQAMRGTLVFEEVLQTTVDCLHETLQVSRCFISLPNADEHLVCQYVSILTAHRDKIIGSHCELFDYFHEILSQGTQIPLESIDANHRPYVKSVIEQFDILGFVMTPLVYKQDYYGVLYLQQCDRERSWTEDEIAMVKAIADQCAIAIHQTQLFQRVQLQAQREQLLNQIGRALNTSLDPNYILQEIVKVTGECFNVDRVFIFEVIAGFIYISHEWDANSGVVSTLNTRIPVEEWLGVINLETGCYYDTPYCLSNLEEVSLNVEQKIRMGKKSLRSLLSAPIFIRDQFFGGIELQTTTCHRVFTDDEITLLQRIADQTAIALHNARTYEDLEDLVKERTKELEAEKLLSDAANRAKSEFLANMSHELRTPLTSILGFSSVLLKQIFGPLNPKQEQYLRNIHASGEHLLALINDLLDLSKIEAGREDLILEPNDLHETCAACLEYIREEANSKGIALSLVIAPSVQTCLADKRRLKQILMNLLSNAVKFTDEGRIDVTVTSAEETIQFAVQDTGIGIARANLAQLFQPFHQLHSGLDKKYQGTGLGLALARKLAQLHGGTITVISEVGQGSCFTLVIPKQEAIAQLPTVQRLEEELRCSN